MNSCSFMQLNQPIYNWQLPFFVIHESAVSLPYVFYFPQIDEMQIPTGEMRGRGEQKCPRISCPVGKQRISGRIDGQFKTADLNISSQICEKQNEQMLERRMGRTECQKDGRNANSNLLRIFFRKLDQELQSSPRIIHNIIKKSKIKVTYYQFIQWFQINKMEHKNYIRLPSAKKLFFNAQKKEYAKIMRILLHHFLKAEAMCAYLTSKKIKKTMMEQNYIAVRNIFRDLQATSNE